MVRSQLKNTREDGVVLITVLLLLVLLSTLAIYRAEDQDLSIRKATNIREAELSFQIATGAEQWAVKLLENDIQQDLQPGTPPIDSLIENWATLGLAEPITVEGTQSQMHIAIVDQQGKLNLNNLIQGKPPPGNQNNNSGGNPNPQINPGSNNDGQDPGDDEDQDGQEESSSENGDQDDDQGGGTGNGGSGTASGGTGNGANNPPVVYWYTIFQNLLTKLGVDPGLADTVVDWIDTDQRVSGGLGAEDGYYESQDSSYRAANQVLSSLSELSQLRGFTPIIIQRLSPYITVLPLQSPTSFTPINVNSVSLELLSAVAIQTDVTSEDFTALAEIRLVEPFESVSAFMDAYEFNSPASLLRGIQPLLDVKSDYFASYSCAKTGRVQLGQISLLEKNRSQENVNVLYRRSGHACPELQEASDDETTDEEGDEERDQN